MNPKGVKRKLLAQTGGRTALVTWLAAGLVLPVHGQQKISGPSPNDTSAATAESSAGSTQVSREVLAELEAMKKRIEQLEAQLKEREGTASSAAMAPTATVATPIVASATLSAAPAPPVAQSMQSEPTASEKKPAAEPFAFADWTWLNGNPRTKEAAFDSKFFTPEIRADVAYHYDFNHPADDTISGSSEVFRSNEVSLTHLGIGGDFHYDHVRARVLS